MKINKICENKIELGRYSEKVIRTAVFAENLHDRSEKTLSSTRKQIRQQKSARNLRIKEIQAKEVNLFSQVNSLENSIAYKIYDKINSTDKLNQFSGRLETLLSRNSVVRAENLVNLEYAKEKDQLYYTLKK